MRWELSDEHSQQVSKCFFICVIQHKFKGIESSFQNNDVLHIKYVSKESTRYLFKWSKRKRNVTRLGSGSDNNRFNIQLSFATGSESATRQKITSPQAVNKNLTDCIISQTNKYRWSWIDTNYIIDWKVIELHINTPQDLFPLFHRRIENPFLSSSSSAFGLSAIMIFFPCIKIRQGISFTSLTACSRLLSNTANCILYCFRSSLLQKGFSYQGLFLLPLTNALSKVGVQFVCKEGFRQFPEVQFQGACNGINIHLAHHHWHVFVIWKRKEGKQGKEAAGLAFVLFLALALFVYPLSLPK